jgi:hypothetical protein
MEYLYHIAASQHVYYMMESINKANDVSIE